jgi:hypothetical protein
MGAMENFLLISDTYPPFSDRLGLNRLSLSTLYVFEIRRAFDPCADFRLFPRERPMTLDAAFLREGLTPRLNV